MTRMAALYGLGLMGPGAKSALAQVKRLLKDSVPGVQEEAKLALERIEGGG